MPLPAPKLNADDLTGSLGLFVSLDLSLEHVPNKNGDAAGVADVADVAEVEEAPNENAEDWFC